MPTYDIRDKKTGRVTEVFMTYEELLAYLRANPDKEKLLAGPMIVSGVASKRMKPNEGFRDILRTIKKANKGSTINTW